MGLMCDFFVASPEEAARHPDGDLACVEATGFTGLECGRLWALLAGEPYAARHALEIVGVRGGVRGREGPWLMQFPAPLIALLAALSPAAIAPVAAAWVATDELDGMAEAAAADMLHALHALARDAVAQAPVRTLYLHVGL
jgi:hypothetical protein